MEKLLELTVRIRVDKAQTHPYPTSIVQIKDLFLKKNSTPSADEKDVSVLILPAVEFDQTKKTIALAERSDVDPDKTESEKDSHQVVRG